MYQPEFTARIEIAPTDAGDLREWRIVLGGAVRGGLSSAHGYLPNEGPVLLDQIEEIREKLGTLLEAYCAGLGGWQLELELP